MTMSFAMRAKRESDTVDQWRGASTCAEIVSVGPVLRARVRGACACRLSCAKTTWFRHEGRSGLLV